MKRFLVLTLIYSLNIILFLFAKSAGAAVVFDTISDVRELKGKTAFTLEGHGETLHVNGRGPAVECLKRARTSGQLAGIELDDNSGKITGCKLAQTRLPGYAQR